MTVMTSLDKPSEFVLVKRSYGVWPTNESFQISWKLKITLQISLFFVHVEKSGFFGGEDLKIYWPVRFHGAVSSVRSRSRVRVRSRVRSKFSTALRGAVHSSSRVSNSKKMMIFKFCPLLNAYQENLFSLNNVTWRVAFPGTTLQTVSFLFLGTITRLDPLCKTKGCTVWRSPWSPPEGTPPRGSPNRTTFRLLQRGCQPGDGSKNQKKEPVWKVVPGTATFR